MTVSPGTARLVRGLVDDAGLFPPTALPVAQAVARHRADHAVAHPVHTDRFLVRTSLLPDLQAELTAQPIDGELWRLGLIHDQPLDAVATAVALITADPRLELAGVEVRLPDGAAADAAAAVRAAVAGVNAPVYVEIPLAGAAPGATRAALEAVHRVGLGAKVRCGGVTPELFPGADDLADFLLTATQLGTPFKCTAGLHHAMRYVDRATGFQHHGVLNILVAVLRARGGDRDAVVDALTTDDAAALAREAGAATPAAQDEARAAFVAYGSCSTATPVADLAALGLAEPLDRPLTADVKETL